MTGTWRKDSVNKSEYQRVPTSLTSPNARTPPRHYPQCAAAAEGLALPQCAAQVAAGSHVFIPKFVPEDMLKAVERYKVNKAMMVPAMIGMMLQALLPLPHGTAPFCPYPHCFPLRTDPSAMPCAADSTARGALQCRVHIRTGTGRSPAHGRKCASPPQRHLRMRGVHAIRHSVQRGR